MPRLRVRCRLLLLAVCLSPLLVEACSSASPEQQVLIDFFRAARLRDNTTLANIAATSFDPRTDGTVQTFTITTIGGERRRSLQIQRLTDRAALASERAAAVDSLTPPGQPDVDLSKMDVEMVAKDVTVAATVRAADGRTLPKTLVFTLQRAVGTEGGQARSGRWIITQLRASRISRAASSDQPN